jgi:ABC-2 type transport system permease protein
VVCFLFTVSGAPIVLDFFHGWAPLVLTNAVASFSFLTHFSAITAGVIDIRDVIFFFTLIALFLCVNVVVIDLKRVTR